MEILNLGKRREMFWDDYLLDMEKTTAQHRINPAQKREVCFTLDHGRETDNACYLCTVKDDKNYKMYYVVWNATYDGTKAFLLESADGLHWERAKIENPGYPDMEENGIVIPGLEDGFYVFYDTNPACPPEEKYKAAARALGTYNGQKNYRGLWSWVSADGYHFSNPRMITDYGTFDSMNTINFIDGRYVCYFRNQNGLGPNGEFVECENANDIGGYCQRLGQNPRIAYRDVRVMYSDDFVNWSKPEMIRFDDDSIVDLYTNQITPCPNAPEILIGFPTRYTSRYNWTQNEDRIGSSAVKKNAIEYYQEERCGLATTDCLFMYSRDGLVWHKYDEAFLTAGYENEHNWVYGDCYPAYGMIDSGRETNYMYCAERYRSPGFAKPLVRYEIRKDGFGCIMTGGKEAVAVTKPLTFEGSVLHLNFESSAFGHIYVDVLDIDGNPLSDKKSFEIYGNNIDRPVCFADGTDFSEFAGKPVRLRFTMLEAKLYSMWFD